MNRVRLVYDEPLVLVLPSGEEVARVTVGTPNPREQDPANSLSVLEVCLPAAEMVNCYRRPPKAKGAKRGLLPVRIESKGTEGGAVVVLCDYLSILVEVDDG